MEFLTKILPKEKHFILEPLSCLFRIILLLYKEDGTKISIINNAITYNHPHMFQGLFRNVNGDKREDLHNIHNPIIKSLEWYPHTDEKYKFFYEQCILGLEKLKKCYSDESIICYTLQHYINAIQMSLQNKQQQDIQENSEEIQCIKESPLLKELEGFWDTHEIEIIYKTFLLLQEKNDDTYIRIIDELITLKEKQLEDYILKYSTSYK